MPKFKVTYEIVTPESAEQGDADERGFICKNCSLRDAIDEVQSTRTNKVGGVESIQASDSRIEHARWITITNSMEFETGAQDPARYISRSPSLVRRVCASLDSLAYASNPNKGIKIMATRWHYQGDINLEYGGMFFDFSNWKWGYVTVVRIDDLDSGCGFSGALCIEELTVSIDDTKRITDALPVIGASMLPNGDIDDNGHTYRKDSLAWRMCLVYSLVSYGAYDTDRSDTVQPDPAGPLKFDGWQATRIRSLRSFVRKQYLSKRGM